MTAADLGPFQDALQRLGRILGHAVSSETVEDYFDDLREFPADAVMRALEHTRKTAKFWPRPAVIREACLLVPGVGSITAIPSWVDPVGGRFFCDTCADSGFVRGLTCDGNGACHIGHCGQFDNQQYAHSFTRRCGCVATNPVMMAERDKARQRNATAHTERG